ncbi:Unannotated [Lentimonas sp. CC19]|nr:Unannotated [Lentimonas sp. CC10]CAA6696857.1 Unannotated [Lentimonas sp. CC19]CAA7071179.1 Unannotated [Lentimonas sp. CC11]
MSEYYSRPESYYEDIHFSTSNWKRPGELAYQRILELSKGKVVAEVGCGEAQILDVLPAERIDYAGCDFSPVLMDQNRKKYPSARFEVIEEPTELPMASNVYDVVFSVFVLEHVVQPERFLREMFRCCKLGGRIVIFCPDYAGRLGIASQVVGFSNGSGIEKIRRGEVFDGLLTGLINKVLMPKYISYKLRNARQDPVFLLNANPACFCRPFYPDADAVYVTHSGEIVRTLRNLGCSIVKNNISMTNYTQRTRTMFLEFVKIEAVPVE